MEPSAPGGRPYKSRKARPCDSCRRRKVTCDMPTGPPCRRCSRIEQPCTFEQGPGPRKRRTGTGFKVALQPTSPLDLMGQDDGLYACTSAMDPFFLPQFDMADFIPVMDIPIQSPHSTIGSPGSGSGLSIAMPIPPTPPPPPPPPPQQHQRQHQHQYQQRERVERSQEACIVPVEGSLEFVPGAFSFYIGPTGVSDVHLLSRESYNEQWVSEPRVSGLRYRLMNLPTASPSSFSSNPTAIPAESTLFGITDHALIANAEPRVDDQTTESARNEFRMMLNATDAWRLVRLYIRYVDPYFPILSGHQIPSSPRTVHTMSLALLTAICATTLPFIMYDESLYTLLLHPPSGRDLCRICWLCITQELHAPTLSTLQACLILQQRLPTNMYLNDTAFTWSLMSTAVAVSQTIGLHRDPTHWTSVPVWERHLRRRLWWGLWISEKWIAFTRGMPSHIHDDDFDVTPLTATDIDDTLQVSNISSSSSSAFSSSSFPSTSSSPQSSPSANSQPAPTPNLTLIYLTSLTGILSTIQKTYYTVKASQRTSNDLQYSLEAARSTRALLKDWRDHLPESLIQSRGVRIENQNLHHASFTNTTTSTTTTMNTSTTRPSTNGVPQQQDLDLDGTGSFYLAYIVTHMTLFRALMRPLDALPMNLTQSPTSAKAVIKGSLLCIKEFVEFVESLTGAQWNSFWHSWSRANFSIAGAFMVHLLHILSTPSQQQQQPPPPPPAAAVAPPPQPIPTSNEATNDSRVPIDGFVDEYRELQGWIRRWRWVNRISANGAAGVKGLTNLGLLKVETLLGGGN